ncbi:putative ribosomal protein S11, mitochondrial [Iris pallida]|uniref:Ribosomal protein S11, mitochondrial n=1 Tax=Iris pallida TaxID=29817 RepID=A0AAX6E6H4_IRIPA|nr:putative ribosomal protein S11, mitochondrial [Iris pallida]
MRKEKPTVKTDRLGLVGASCFKSMNFVHSISKEDEQCSQKKNKDFVSVLLFTKKKHQTFVTVTDARGNKKTGASTCCLGKERVVSSFSACCCSNSRTDRAIRQKDWFEVSCYES